MLIIDFVAVKIICPQNENEKISPGYKLLLVQPIHWCVNSGHAIFLTLSFSGFVSAAVNANHSVQAFDQTTDPGKANHRRAALNLYCLYQQSVALI